MDTISTKAQETREEFCYVLIGNIIDKHYYGEQKEIKSGTKHFRAGAKVYLLPEYGGMGHEKIPVYGLPRRRKRRIQVVINAEMIKNLRVKKTYDPTLIKKIKDTFFYALSNEKSLSEFANSMNRDNAELSE